MTSKKRLKNVYESTEFWDAYATLFFTSAISTQEAENVAEKVLDRLNSHHGLDILCLGIGGCVLEYPLIQAIKSTCPELGVFGVDSSRLALSISSQLLSSNRWDIDTLENYQSVLKQAKQTARHNNLLYGDLNQPRPWIQKNRFSGKGWLHNLKNSSLPKQFDLIFLSGCLHHLNWWRTTACAAFSLLKPSGILLIPKIDGAFRHIDGHLDYRKSNPLQDSLSAFWSKPLVAEAKRIVGASQAIAPVEIQDFLGKLFATGQAEGYLNPKPGSYTYRFSNLLGRESLFFLMKNRAFSTLRRIATAVGDSNYEDAVKETKENLKEYYNVETEVVWQVWQKPEIDLPSTRAFLGKFLGFPDTPIPVEERLQVEKFESEESLNVSSRMFLKPSIGSNEFSSAIRRFVCSGLLSDYCTSGLIGQDLLGRKSLGSTIAFLNPSNTDTRRSEITNFLAYTKYWSSRGYSNGETLLSKSISNCDRPVVLIISRDETGEALPRIELQNRVLPSHLQLHCRVSMGQTKALSVLSRRQWFGDITNEMRRITPDGPSLYHDLGFVFDVPNWEKTSQLGNQVLLTRHEQKEIIDSLRYQNREKNESRFEPFITSEFVESIYMMGAFPGWNSIGVFPMSYLDPDNQRFVGLDTVYAFYSFRGHTSRTLDLPFFAFEYQKFRTLFDQLCMRRLGELGIYRGVNRAFGAFSHEVSKIASVLDSGVLQPLDRVFDVVQRDKTIQAENAWNPPAGRLVPSEQLVRNISSWSVCPLPESINWLNDFLFLWSSAPGSINAVLRKANTLLDLCNLAKDMAISTILANKLKIADWDFGNVLAFPAMKEQWRKSIPRIELRVIPSCMLRKVHGETEELVSNILRAIVAALANALKNASDNSKIDFRVSYDPCNAQTIVFSILNTTDFPVSSFEKKDQGTFSVLSTCLTNASVDTESLFFGPVTDHVGESQNAKWRTSFSIPLKIRSLRSKVDVEWLTRSER